VDDDGNVLFRLEKGAKGILSASQISSGEENNLNIWVYGEKKTLAWYQENPNYLRILEQDAPEAVWKRGNAYVAAKSPAAGRATRTPSGHPEAFFEAYANQYRNFCDTIRARAQGRRPTKLETDFPGVEDGVFGMKFIDAVCDSAEQGNVWKAIV
jgi:predicted dehydrogenase